MALKLIFLGPPGAGKGTQAKRLSADHRLAHISTGDMLRAAVSAGTPIGLEVKAILDSGKLAPDELMIRLIEERTAQPDCSPGYILDGFPRTVPQAEALEAMFARKHERLSAVMLFDVAEQAVLKRLDSRRATEGRADDNPQVQIERMRVYRDQTAPLIDFYQRKQVLHRIDATGSVDFVYDALKKLIAELS